MSSLSIQIATHNRAASLLQTLRLLEPSLAGDEVELVLIDNASTDDTPRVIAEFAAGRSRVKAVGEPRAGKSLALNRGAAVATGDILVWTDDDVLPQPGWLEELVRPIIEGKLDATGGRIVVAESLDRPWTQPGHRDRMAQIPQSQGDFFLAGPSMAVTRKFYDLTPGFDPNLGPAKLGNWEDGLLYRQLREVGARIGLAEKSVLVHNPDPSRLQRQSWLLNAVKVGRSHAYVRWHWEHDSIRFPRLRKWKKERELRAWRARNRPNLDPLSEGAEIAELELVELIAFYDQFRIESAKPRGLSRQQKNEPDREKKQGHERGP